MLKREKSYLKVQVKQSFNPKDSKAKIKFRVATPKTVTMPDVTGLTVSTAVQTLNRKSISSSSIEYHDYNTGAKLDKDKFLAAQRSFIKIHKLV